MSCKYFYMNRHLLLYFCLCTFLGISVLCGCSNVPDKLKTAESLMETAPDSAYHLLQKIKPGQLNTRSDKAFYALLMSQALDKKNIQVESDSLIEIATDYYNDKDPVRAAYAWFYMSRCANNRGNANIHAAALLKAQEYAEQTDNYKLRGLVYGDKGIIYCNICSKLRNSIRFRCF